MNPLPTGASPVPALSIGVPVYNGDQYLEDCLRSLLAQDFRDFELIISDNASTDRTEAICRRFAATDPRVRYHREPANRGASWNFNNVVHLARAEYFKWAASDDLHAPDHLGKCMAVIRAKPETVICYTQSEIIDAAGASKGVYEDPMTRHHPTPAKRFLYLLRNMGLCDAVYGIMRTRELLTTDLLGAYNGSDITLLAELSLRGNFHRIEEPLFQRRLHANASSPSNPGTTELAMWFDPLNKGKLICRNWRHVGQHLRAIGRAEIGVIARLACLFSLARWSRDVQKPLFLEAILAFRWYLRKAFSRKA